MTLNQDELLYNPAQQSAARGMMIAIISFIFLMGGLAAGLYYAWEISPVVEQDTRPDQLQDQFKLDYVIAIGADYRARGEEARTYNLLLDINPQQDPFQIAADAVCDMQSRGLIQTSEDIDIVRHLIDFFTGIPSVSPGCDIQPYATTSALNLPSPTPRPTTTFTPAPVSTKTPTPPFAPASEPVSITPTPVGLQIDGEFTIISSNRTCGGPATSGLLQIFVEEANTGRGVPGQEIEVRWNTGTGQRQERFFTGLKPDVDDGYADFVMEQGLSYQVILPGVSRLSDRLEATICDAEQGVLWSYQIIFRSP